MFYLMSAKNWLKLIFNHTYGYSRHWRDQEETERIHGKTVQTRSKWTVKVKVNV